MTDKVRTVITRGNLESLLESGQIEVAMRNGNWWQIRRNGATKRWRKDQSRIAIPIKAGLKAFGKITETDFRIIDGVEVLDPAQYRAKA